MSCQDDTFWEADRHTLAKHAILRKYLQAWMPILSGQSARIRGGSKRVLYLDGFAGPGRYLGGEPGSPLIALDVALTHARDFPVPVRLAFIEKNPARCNALRALIERRQGEIDESHKVEVRSPICGDCSAELDKVLDQYQADGREFGPALVFFDQFGYSQVPMELIRRVMLRQTCESLLFFNWRDLNRFITDPQKAAGISRAFGTTSWRTAIHEPPRKREALLLRCYIRSLRENGRVKYSCHFAMYDSSERLLSWLVFCSNHLEGLRQMKRSMWSVDETGAFKFFDSRDPNQLQLLEGFDDTWLAHAIRREFAGREVSMPEVSHFVLTETPCHKYAGALKRLEGDCLEVVSPQEGRRSGTFVKYEGDPEFRMRFS